MTEHGPGRAFPLVLFLLPLLVAVPVTLLVVGNDFDGLYGQDAYAYDRYASGPLRQALLRCQLPPPFFWPPGYPLLIFLFSVPLGMGTAAGQVASLVAGSLVPLLTALLAWELWGDVTPAPNRRRLATVAGVFAALVGQLWQSSAVIMSDTTALAAATLAAWALARYARGAGGRWLLLAAGAAAYAVLTRWAFALIAFPITAAALVLLARRTRRQALVQALAATLVVLAVLAPVLVATLQGATTLEGTGGAFIGDLEVVPWHPRNALQREFRNVDGLLSYRLPNGLYYALAPAHRYFFTPLLALLLLPGLYAVGQRRGALRWLLLLAWPLVLYLFLVGAPWQNFRFVLPYLPPLAIVAAAGADILFARFPGRARRLLALLLAGGFVWMAVGGWTLTKSFIVRKEANLDTMKWVEEQVPADARLFTFAITLTFEQYSALDVYDLFWLTPAQMAALLREDRPAYLLIDLDNIERQWQARAPGANYRWLQQEARLVPVGRHRQFSLLRIEPPP